VASRRTITEGVTSMDICTDSGLTDVARGRSGSVYRPRYSELEGLVWLKARCLHTLCGLWTSRAPSVSCEYVLQTSPAVVLGTLSVYPHH
jgi:hypothetical protein